jgi:hypothetical protein
MQGGSLDPITRLFVFKPELKPISSIGRESRQQIAYLTRNDPLAGINSSIAVFLPNRWLLGNFCGETKLFLLTYGSLNEIIEQLPPV